MQSEPSDQSNNIQVVGEISLAHVYQLLVSTETLVPSTHTVEQQVLPIQPPRYVQLQLSIGTFSHSFSPIQLPLKVFNGR